MEKEDIRVKANQIMQSLTLGQLACVNLQLGQLPWDSIRLLMDYFGCTIGDLDEKVLAHLQGKGS